MLNPSLFGIHFERRTRELRALPEPRPVGHARNRRRSRSRGLLRAAVGTRLIAWGESLTYGLSDAGIGRVGRQPC
jgi:hypothetical protein